MLETLEAESELAALDDELLSEELEIDLGDDPLGDEVDLLAEEEQPEEDFVTPSAELDSYPELELDSDEELAISIEDGDVSNGMSETERQLAESLGNQSDLHLQLEDELEEPFEDDLDDLFGDVGADEQKPDEVTNGTTTSGEQHVELEEQESLEDLNLDLDAPFDEAAALAALDEITEPSIQPEGERESELDDLSIDLDTPFDEAAAMAAMDEGLETPVESNEDNDIDDAPNELAMDLEATFDEEAALAEADEAVASLGEPSGELTESVESEEESVELDIDPESFLEQLEEAAENDADLGEAIEIDESAIEDEFMADLEETDFESLLDEYAEPQSIDPEPQPELEVNFDALLSEELDEPFEIEEEQVATEQVNEVEQAPEDFLNIDDLIAQSDDVIEQEEPYQEPNMDVGLDDFEELLAGDNPTDVDLEEDGFAAKLDLARAYLEIEDFDSAVSALEEVMENGPESVQAEARILKEQIK
ncbi:FimV/HubP family polar landmark protein [Pseudoalteromonas luteoviolacea]|uniref:Uncharacterized protein n=1 Tax=Pseudoalteromonas luteoviolacea S4060-1 TaxID=1365257 RepID=A0A167MP92_9GAMM|nr:FimV/HubP family polar landmark protein [Pseudoalteromonas luteoviolacea]KZN66727.1 hypothetical protein N478_17960 [Pseudoalteromonas luteoviolacea S4060-1]